MATIPIYKRIVFGQLDDNNNIKYFTPTGGYLVYVDESGRTHKYRNPTEAQMNLAGWYRVVNIADDGTDYINDNILYHYTGTPYTEEPFDGEEPTEGGE